MNKKCPHFQSKTSFWRWLFKCTGWNVFGILNTSLSLEHWNGELILEQKRLQSKLLYYSFSKILNSKTYKVTKIVMLDTAGIILVFPRVLSAFTSTHKPGRGPGTHHIQPVSPLLVLTSHLTHLVISCISPLLGDFSVFPWMDDSNNKKERKRQGDL